MYTRDNTGQDYADQRYYGVGTGRFLTVDAGGVKTASPSDPSSWNRYAYVGGDPVSFGDRHGLLRNIMGSCNNLVNGNPQDGCDSGDGGGDYKGGNCTYDTLGFEENPECSEYDSRQLECNFLPNKTKTPAGSVQPEVVPDGTSGQAFADPISLSFHAIGGTGDCTFSVVQDISITGFDVYSSGYIYSGNGGIYPDPTLPSELVQSGSTATFSDLPALWASLPGAGNLVAADMHKVIATTVSVTDVGTGQTVACPSVIWSATFNLSLKNGKLQGKGNQAKVISVENP